MANIHRINDVRNDPRHRAGDHPAQQPQNALSTTQIVRRCQQLRIPFFSGQRPVKNPRQQSYCDFLITAFCPVIKPLSFTIIICLIDLAVFLACVITGLDRSGQLLQVQATTLDTFKANIPLPVYRGQVYRLITAIGLHLHFLHLALNLLATLILCSRIEQTYRVWYTMLFYFLSGIMGNIFSDCVNTNVFRVAVGASTALYGLVGVLLGYIVINWAGLAFMPAAHKCRLVMVVVMMLLFSVFFINTGASENVDYYGHLGGFLGGLWLAGIPPSILNTGREKMLRGVAIGLFCVQALICFLVFYLGKPELQIFRLF